MSKRKTDKIESMDLDRRACKRAAKALWAAFIWSGSREGGEYWHKIAKRLESLAETPKKKATP